MKITDYKAALEAARSEMQELLQDRALIDMRLGQLKDTIDALVALVKEKPAELPSTEEVFGETGITAAIRVLLSHSRVPLAPMQIRTELMNRGFDLSDYANAMAVVHNTLKRLDKQGELMTVRDPSGQVIAYTTRRQGGDEIEDSLKSVFASQQKADRIAKAKDELRKK
jgi:hypothetical protein